MNHRRGRDGLPDISFARPSLLETNEDGGLEEIYEIKKAFGDDKATNLYLPEVSETSISIFLRDLPNPDGKEISNLLGACLPTTNL